MKNIQRKPKPSTGTGWRQMAAGGVIEKIDMDVVHANL